VMLLDDRDHRRRHFVASGSSRGCDKSNELLVD